MTSFRWRGVLVVAVVVAAALFACWSWLEAPQELPAPGPATIGGAAAPASASLPAGPV